MSAAGEKVAKWIRSQVKRSNAGGVLYNAIRIDTGVECDEGPSHDCALIDRRVARLNTAGSTKLEDSGLTFAQFVDLVNKSAAGEKVATIPIGDVVDGLKDLWSHMNDYGGSGHSMDIVKKAVALLTQRDALEAREKVLREALERISARASIVVAEPMAAVLDISDTANSALMDYRALLATGAP